MEVPCKSDISCQNQVKFGTHRFNMRRRRKQFFLLPRQSTFKVPEFFIIFEIFPLLLHNFSLLRSKVVPGVPVHTESKRITIWPYWGEEIEKIVFLIN